MLDATRLFENEIYEPDEYVVCQKLDLSWEPWIRIERDLKSRAMYEKKLNLVTCAPSYKTHTGDPSFCLYAEMDMVLTSEGPEKPDPDWWRKVTSQFRYSSLDCVWHLERYVTKPTNHQIQAVNYQTNMHNHWLHWSMTTNPKIFARA